MAAHPDGGGEAPPSPPMYQPMVATTFPDIQGHPRVLKKIIVTNDCVVGDDFYLTWSQREAG